MIAGPRRRSIRELAEEVLRRGQGSLGRGIDALIPVAAGDESEDILELNPAEIRPNPYQPRQIFDDGKIQELAASMKRTLFSP